MIARIRIADRTVATLDDGLRWSADSPAVAAALRDLFDAADKSPAAGDWIRRHVARMAGVLGGAAEFAHPLDAEPGRVY
jgi:hypothetical protein